MEHQRSSDPAIQTVRELATHSADIRHLQNDMDKMIKDMDEIKETIKDKIYYTAVDTGNRTFNITYNPGDIESIRKDARESFARTFEIPVETVEIVGCQKTN